MKENQKIGIIIGTNRKNAKSVEVAEYYAHELEKENITTKVINLQELPQDFAFSALYDYQGQNLAFNRFQELIDSLHKLIFIIPEYNGSYPGVTKAFLDGLRYPDTMEDKKVALVGLGSGVQGNAVGISHLSDVLSYMGANVLGLKVKLGSIYQCFDGKNFTHEKSAEYVNAQVKKFLAF